MFDYPKKALYLLIFAVLSLIINSCIKNSSKQQPPTVNESSSIISTVGSEPLPEPWERVNLEGEGASTYDASTDSFNLSTQALSGKNSHYVYQEISNNFTIRGCIQNLTSDDPEAKAGLMLRQNNTNTSEYVYVYSIGDRTEVEYLKYVDGIAEVETVQGQQGSTSMCYKLEREENDVLVYERDADLNWVLITTITLSLVDPIQVGLAVCASEEVQAIIDDVLVEAQGLPSDEPKADFTVSLKDGKAPLTVNFDAGSSEGENLAYEWDFGDISSGTGKQVAHTYEYPGTYPAILTVSNGDNKDTYSQIIYVEAENSDELPPEHLRTATSSEGKREYRLWWLRRNLARAGVSHLLDYVDEVEIAGPRALTMDRQWVVYEREAYEDNGAPSPFSTHDYYLVNLQTGDITSLNSLTEKRLDSITLSPDATLLTFRDKGNVYLLNVQTGDVQHILSFADTLDEASGASLSFAGGYTFNPDGTKLGFFMEYEFIVGEGVIKEQSYVDDEGIILFKIDLDGELPVLVNIDNIRTSKIFVEEVKFKDVGGPQNFGGFYWEGETFKWYPIFSYEGSTNTISGQNLTTLQNTPAPSVANAGADFLLFPWESNISLSMTRGYAQGATHGSGTKYHYSLDFDASTGEAEGMPILAALSGELYSLHNNGSLTDYPFNSAFESIGRCACATSSCATNQCSWSLSSTVSRYANSVWIKQSGIDDVWYFVRHTHLMYQSTPENIRPVDSDIIQGSVVGLMSDTGWVYSSNNTPVHLHFQVNKLVNNNNLQDPPTISVKPEPIDGETSVTAMNYTSSNVLEDLQMASTFHIRQDEADVDVEQRLYDDEADAWGGAVTKDHDILDMVTINSEGDLDVEVDVIYPGSTAFAQSSPSVLLEFRDDNKPTSSRQEHVRSRFLPVETSKLVTATQQVAVTSSSTTTLNFHIDSADIETLTASEEASTLTPLDLWLEREIQTNQQGGTATIPVWAANHPIKKDNATDDEVFRNPIRVRVVDIEPIIAGIPLSRMTDADPLQHTISQPTPCTVEVNVKGKGIYSFEVQWPNNQTASWTNPDINNHANRDISFTAGQLVVDDGDYTIRVIVTMDDGNRNPSQQVTEERMIRVENNACSRVVDIDDGGVDGNQRVYHVASQTQSTTDADGNGIADTLPSEELVVISEVDFEGQDIDKNDAIGDGDTNSGISTAGLQTQAIVVVPNVDMSDFRRIRDWLLQGESEDPDSNININLNGSADNPKNDDAVTYGDYNNDGKLNFNDTEILFNTEILDTDNPGIFEFEIFGEDITVNHLPEIRMHEDQENYPDTPVLNDFEIFYNIIKHENSWGDPNYLFEDIPGLLGSGDIEVWPHFLFANFPEDNNSHTLSVNCLKSEVVGESQARNHKRGIERDPHIEDYERQVYTLKVGTYTLKATAYEAEDCTGEAVFNFKRKFEVKLGSDDLWDPAPPVFDTTVNGALLMNNSVIDEEKLDPEGYYVIIVAPPSNPGEEATCEDDYGYSEEYSTKDNVTCLDFSVKAKNITAEPLWTLTEDGANFTTTLAGIETKLDNIPLQLPQEIQSKRLLSVPGTYNLDSTLIANLNEELGYEPELNTFEAPTVKIKLIYEEYPLVPNITDPIPNPLSFELPVGESANGSFSFGNDPFIPAGITDFFGGELQYTLSTGASWLNLNSPLEGTLAKDETTEVLVTVTCPEQEGTYTTNIEIASNDPDTPVTIVSVELSCTDPQPEEPDITDPNPVSLTGYIGEVITTTISFSNEGNANLTYRASEEASWLVIIAGSLGTVLPSQAATVKIRATCPTQPSSYLTTIEITSNDPDEPTKTATVSLICKDIETIITANGIVLEGQNPEVGFMEKAIFCDEDVDRKPIINISVSVLQGKVRQISVTDALSGINETQTGDSFFAETRPLSGPVDHTVTVRFWLEKGNVYREETFQIGLKEVIEAENCIAFSRSVEILQKVATRTQCGGEGAWVSIYSKQWVLASSPWLYVKNPPTDRSPSQVSVNGFVSEIAVGNCETPTPENPPIEIFLLSLRQQSSARASAVWDLSEGFYIGEVSHEKGKAKVTAFWER